MAELTIDLNDFRTLRQTELGTVLTCGRKWELERVAGLPRRVNHKMLVGTAFHRGAELLYRDLQVGNTPSYSEAEQCALENLGTSLSLASLEDMELDGTEAAFQALAKACTYKVSEALRFYVMEVLPDIVLAGRPLAVEEHLATEYRGFEISGTLDLMGGDSIIRDHKLTFGYLANEMPHTYWGQLARYSWLWNRAVGDAPSGVEINQVSVAKLDNKTSDKRKVEARSFRDRDMETLIRVGKQLVDDALDIIEHGLERGWFPRNAIGSFGGYCDTCPFRGDMCLGRIVGAA